MHTFGMGLPSYGCHKGFKIIGLYLAVIYKEYKNRP